MKNTFKIMWTATLAIVFLGAAGCSKNGSEVNTARLQSAFQNSPPVDRTEVQNAITAVKAGNYSDALASAQKVATSVNLTPEQKSAIQDFIGQMRTKALGM